MLRITQSSPDEETVSLRLDGTLTTTGCGEVEALCLQYQESDGKLIVVFMNEEVAKRLMELRSNRLSIINCSPFVEMLLRTVAT